MIELTTQFNDVWFTADTHFYHKNIIEYCNRPYINVEAMNEALIENWNKCVKPDDHIFHLGDFAFANEFLTREIIKRLNGRIHIVVGNHDAKQEEAFKDYFETCERLQEIRVNAQTIVLCHFPLETWHWRNSGTWMLHGHEHGYRENLMQCKRMDVGVDPNGLRPVNIDEVAYFMGKCGIKPPTGQLNGGQVHKNPLIFTEDKANELFRI